MGRCGADPHGDVDGGYSLFVCATFRISSNESFFLGRTFFVNAYCYCSNGNELYRSLISRISFKQFIFDDAFFDNNKKNLCQTRISFDRHDDGDKISFVVFGVSVVACSCLGIDPQKMDEGLFMGTFRRRGVRFGMASEKLLAFFGLGLSCPGNGILLGDGATIYRRNSNFDFE